jgi:hypothetical protein
MREIKLTNSYISTPNRFGFMTAIAVLWGLAIVLGVIWLLVADDGNTFPHVNLLGWLGLTAVSILIPNFILYRKNQFKIYNPIVFASFTYFFPAMVIGGLLFLSGMSNPYFAVFIQDFETDISMTFWAVILGFTGLSVGFLTPIGKIAGSYIESKLPQTDWNPQKIIIPTLFLMTIGILNSFFAFTLGLIGFQKAAEIGEYDGLIYVVTMFSTVGFFLLCLIVFKTPKFSINTWLIALLLVLITVARALLAGNRGSLLSSFIVVALAFTFSARKISFNQKILAGIVLVVFVLGGMIYGTTFRRIKESEARSNVDDYVATWKSGHRNNFYRWSYGFS